MAKKQKYETVEVEEYTVYKWECPDCGLEHEESEATPNGAILECSDEFRYAGCGKKFKADII